MKTNADWQDELYAIGVALYEQCEYVKELTEDSDGGELAERELQLAREERNRLALILQQRRGRYRAWLTARQNREG